MTPATRVDLVQCVYCLRNVERDRLAHEEALATKARRRAEQRSVVEARWAALMASVPTASSRDLAGYFGGTVIEPADYVYERTHLRIVSHEASALFQWMDSPDLPGDLGSGFAPGQYVTKGPLVSLCELANSGAMPTETAEGRLVRVFQSFPAADVARALQQVGPAPMRHVIFSYSGRVVSEADASGRQCARSLDELKSVRRGGRKEKTRAWIFDSERPGNNQVSRMPGGLVVTVDGRFARLDGQKRKFTHTKRWGENGDPLSESMEVGEVEQTGDRWLVLGSGELTIRELGEIRRLVRPGQSD